jgi:hypothetical protein
MRTTVEISPGLQPTLDAWQRTLSTDPVAAGQIAVALLDALKQRLIATEGRPADGYHDQTTDPPESWYELSGGMWAVYSYTDGGFLFSRWREVLIFGFAPHPPSRAVRTSPRT